MAVYLMSNAEEENSLMHYRRGGEKKGVRNWQNKDGSYTPAGYRHYAEMYGWGKRKKGSNSKHSDKQKKSNDFNLDKGHKNTSPEQQSGEKNDSAKIAKTSGKFAIGSAASFYTAAVATRFASCLARSHHLASIAKTIDSRTIADQATQLMTKVQAFHDAKLAEAFSHVADVTSVLGTAAVVACGVGALGYGAVAAYMKVRETLNRKRSKKDQLEHGSSDEIDQMAILDSLDDEIKLAIMLMIDENLKK